MSCTFSVEVTCVQYILIADFGNFSQSLSNSSFLGKEKYTKKHTDDADSTDKINKIRVIRVIRALLKE